MGIPAIPNLLTRASAFQNTAGDVFFGQKIFRIALFINFCASTINACSPPPPSSKSEKGKGNVLKQQLFEAHLPNLLQRRSKQRKQLKKKVLDQQPKLGAAWKETENPEFLLLSDVPDGPDALKPKSIGKRQGEFSGEEKEVGKRGLSLTSNLDLLRQHSGFGARGGDRGRALASRGKKWTGVANNMQLLREGSWERRTRGDRLYMEVARRQGGGLANLG